MLTASAPAKLFYDAADFDVITPGKYVLCAVSGAPIPLDELRYWSAAFQEAYRSAEESTAAFLAGGAKNIAK